MSRRKPKVEAWAIVNCGKTVAVSLDKPEPRLDPESVKVVHLVPADPRREAELRDLRRVAKAAKLVMGELATNGLTMTPGELALRLAIEKMQRGGK